MFYLLELIDGVPLIRTEQSIKRNHDCQYVISGILKMYVTLLFQNRSTKYAAIKEATQYAKTPNRRAVIIFIYQNNI